MGATYRRIHANAQITSICIVIFENPALLLKCSPFLMPSAPAEYTTVSKAAIDPVNGLLMDKSQDAIKIQ